MKKILVVDDDPDILSIVELILRSNGFEVVTQTTGFGVPDIVKKIKPDLILLDVLLPGKSGVEICKELKASSNVPPIILFSAHAKKRKVLESCKADGFIGKPFELEIFLATVKSLAA